MPSIVNAGLRIFFGKPWEVINYARWNCQHDCCWPCLR